MTTRYLIVADPLDRLNPVFDLGVCVSVELLGRGIQADYLDLYSSDAGMSEAEFLSRLPVRTILGADASRPDFWNLGPVHPAAITDYRIVLHRTDPPVDERFIRYAKHFETAPDSVIQINRPPATYELSEHTVHLRYPEYAAPTTVAASPDELVAAVRAQPGEAVCKPKNTYCGIGIDFVPSSEDETALRRYWQKWGPEVIVQPYIDAIETSGDLRILTIEQRVLGSVLRVPAQGSRLANLHQGATAAALKPTPRQLDACRVVAADLNPLGLHLLGLDFIGEFLTEVNITSPTTIVQINQVNGIRADIDLVDELERMWRDKVGDG
jgi:glutathione synthase